MLRARYGPGAVVRMRSLPWGEVVLIADPALVKPVLTAPADVLRAGASNLRFLQPIFGRRGVLVLDEDEHLATRRKLLPPFHGDAIPIYERVVRAETERRIAGWKVGHEFRMDDESRAIALEVILACVFGATGDRRLVEMRDVLQRVTHITPAVSLWFLWPRLAATPPWRGYARAIARANDILDELIEDRRRDPSLADRDDILSLLIKSGEGDDEWLRDQLMSLLGAGHETTTTALAWAVELLAHHPDKRRQARESDAYLDAVINETLRVRTVLPAVTRQAATDIQLGPWRIPAGTTLLPMSGAVHVNPSVYEDPFEFRPERFLQQRPGTYSWFPFGGGRRRCIGATFALMEMRVALRAMLDHADWEPVSSRPERGKDFHITTVPARGARMRRTA